MTAATKESHNRDLRDLTLTPAGHLLLREADAREADGWTRGVAKAFGSDPCAGLFALAARRPEIPPPPSLAFWREFAAGYLTQLCRTPEVASKKTSSVEPPPLQELAALVVDAPPMQGGEYLSADVLASLWTDLDAWVRQQLRGTSLTEWLRQHAPGWHQVGRVCFHLAENKRDADFPFAFLATYAPRLSRAGKVQYQPLSRALQEYAGARNKPGLVRLLSPVQEASAHSDLVRRLVDSGEIFQPLAWTPAEAYELLTDVPTLEECGLLVRLPDWWHTRPRPRVSVSVGNAKPSRFGVDTMLDFDVGLALGDEA